MRNKVHGLLYKGPWPLYRWAIILTKYRISCEYAENDANDYDYERFDHKSYLREFYKIQKLA